MIELEEEQITRSMKITWYILLDIKLPTNISYNDEANNELKQIGSNTHGYFIC